MGGDSFTPGGSTEPGWDGTDGLVSSGGLQNRGQANGVLRGHTDMLRAVAWSPCGRKELNSMKQQTATVDGSEIRG